MTPVLQDGPDDRSAAGAGTESRSGSAERGPRRRTGVVLAAVAALVVGGLLAAVGPRARFGGAWVEPAIGADVDAYLAAHESAVPDLREGEAKSVLWADESARDATPISLVYLHGFSADRHEVEPLVSDLARHLRANAYFARLSGHGRSEAAMGEATAADWVADAAEAVAIGGRIGERVVLVGTSTGGTLALWAAAQEEAAGRIDALVLISPNLGLRDPSARILTWPWGGVIARAVVGSERCFEPTTLEQARHWTLCYPTQALLPMMALVRQVRSMDLSSVRVPTLLVYSADDEVVNAEETERLLAGLGALGPATFLVEGSGDPAHHVVAGSIMSPETTDAVRERILLFLRRSAVGAS